MPGSFGVQPGEVQHLIDEVSLLHVRLHRIAVALALTEDLLADTFDNLSEDETKGGTVYQLHAQRARVAAEECRLFAARVNVLGPPKPGVINLNSQRQERTLY